MSESFDLNILNNSITYQDDNFIFTNWIDCLISYKDQNICQNSNYYDIIKTKTRFAIINNIAINNAYPTGLIHLWTANDTTIFDENNNFADDEITNALLANWHFEYNTECNWFQQHIMQRNINLSHKILINANKCNSTSLLWAFRTHNLPFEPQKSSNCPHYHSWRQNLIQHILQQIQHIIHNNKWLCTLIYYTTIKQFHNMSRWDTLILIQQLKINLNNQIDTPTTRKAILIFIKSHFISQNLQYPTTLKQIYQAQNQKNKNKIKSNQNKFQDIFNIIKKHLNYKIPNKSSHCNITQQLGFDPTNFPKRQPLCNKDIPLLKNIIPNLPPLQPTNLALGYSPCNIETEICTLGPKFIPQPLNKDIDFHEIHNGLSRTFNQIKFRMH